VRWAGEELADGIPQKVFENEARRAPLAAQERVTRLGVSLCRNLNPFQLWSLGKNLNALLAVDWTRLSRGRQRPLFADTVEKLGKLRCRKNLT
jgi:hypothetical protein